MNELTVRKIELSIKEIYTFFIECENPFAVYFLISATCMIIYRYFSKQDKWVKDWITLVIGIFPIAIVILIAEYMYRNITEYKDEAG